ncbi:hypothetical protein ACFL5Q_06555 [Planctomycetota bacterium]
MIDTLPEDAHEPDPTGKIDLAKYRTGDLAEQLIDLISVPKAFRRIAKATSFGAFLSVVACCLILVYSEMTGVTSLIICAYALAIGLIFGLILAVLRVLAAAAKNIESILQIVFEITGKVATDYEQVQIGKAQLPSGGELVEQVYDGVVLPVMEKAVASAFGVLQAPLLWTYHRTIGWAVRYVVRHVKRREVTAEDEQQLAEEASGGMAVVARYSETIQAYTSSAAELVGNVGNKIRFFAMLPLYIVFFVSLTVAIVPIIVVWCLATGEANP